jgi:hypothetical protein
MPPKPTKPPSEVFGWFDELVSAETNEKPVLVLN